MIRVSIVDDHEIIRKGLSLVFASSDDVELVGEAAGGEEAFQMVKQTKPDVILMDLRMPGKNGIQASREIKRCGEQAKIIILSALDDEEDIVAAIECGVDGYLLKSVSAEELIDAVRVVANGKSYLHPQVARTAMAAMAESQISCDTAAKQLSVCESRVLRLMAEGFKNKEIAAKLYLSEETVKTHVSNILSKLNQTDRMQAVLFALRNNLVSLDPEVEAKIG